MAKISSATHNKLRQQLAQEAARLIHDHGIADFRLAKIKAAERLNCGRAIRLPSNREIEQAIAAHNRIFAGDSHEKRIALMRESAVAMMEKLQRFCPFLVGEVLSGHVTDHSLIRLHVFSDAPESVTAELEQNAVNYSSIASRQRIRRDQLTDLPGLRIDDNDFPVVITVFPERMKAHPPICPITGRPMRRAQLTTVISMARDGEIYLR